MEFLANMVAETLIAGGIVYADAGVGPIHPTVAYYTKLFESFAGRFTDAEIAGMLSSGFAAMNCMTAGIPL